MFRWLLALALIGSSACVVAVEDPTSSFTVANESDYDVYSVQIAFSDGGPYSRNLLGRDILFSGEALTIEVLECDFYDVRVVDEFGVSCELFDNFLCADDDLWVLTNRELDSCF